MNDDPDHSGYLQNWLAIAEKMRLRIRQIAPSALGLPHRLEKLIVLESFGAENGIVLFPPGTKIGPLGDEIVARGFGYSVVSPGDLNSSEGREAIREMLRDWGWSGPSEEAPDWL